MTTLEYLNMVITQYHGVFRSTMVLLYWRNTEIVSFYVVAFICVCHDRNRYLLLLCQINLVLEQ